MNALTMNLVFGFLGVLIAVGIPIAGLLWQRREEMVRRRTGQRSPASPSPSSATTQQRRAA